MPTGTLPASGKRLWEQVYDASKADGDSEETAAQKAWGAVKNAGWHKKDGVWVKNADIQEFSLTIRKATFDERTGEMRWKADTSDIDADLYDDNMSLELFSDFLERIERAELPPEPIRQHYESKFWKGGMPYLSLSHYADLDGDAVPGVVDAIFVDGRFLKAKGRLFNTSLGKAVWSALRSDLEQKSDAHNPVRISIAFLDYQHRHKDTGTVFTRSFTDPEQMVCSECQQNAKKKKMGGKVFMKGLLIHLAMTRVPVNQRTLMEVDKAMTTRKEDAESIVGADLAAEIDVKSQLVGKAELEDAVVTRSDEEQTTPEDAPVLDAIKSLTEQVAALTELMRAAYAKKEEKEGEGSLEDEKEDEKEMKSEVVLEPATSVDPAVFAVALSEALAPLGQKFDILIAALSQKSIPANAVPERRSIAASNVAQMIPGQSNLPAPGTPMKIGDFVKRSVNGQ